MVPATGFEPARPAEDFGFLNRRVYRSATRAHSSIKNFRLSVKRVNQVYQANLNEPVNRYAPKSKPLDRQLQELPAHGQLASASTYRPLHACGW